MITAMDMQKLSVQAKVGNQGEKGSWYRQPDMCRHHSKTSYKVSLVRWESLVVLISHACMPANFLRFEDQ